MTDITDKKKDDILVIIDDGGSKRAFFRDGTCAGVGNWLYWKLDYNKSQVVVTNDPDAPTHKCCAVYVSEHSTLNHDLFILVMSAMSKEVDSILLEDS